MSDGAPTYWTRGAEIGRGGFAGIHLAIPKPDTGSPLMAVKSSDLSTADSLRNERDVLLRLGGRCRNIIRCFGENSTVENGRRFHNLFLEYAAGGSLSDHLRRSPENRFSELDVRNYTNSILRGLEFIHDCGFVHSDIKLQNVLLFGDGEVKIADFGLAGEKRNDGEENRGGFELRGTPMYMSPEVVAGAAGGPPADVWALGCAVVEMVTGKPAWRCEPGCGVAELLCRIGSSNRSPEIPESLSEDGKDFLRKCFVRDPRERWTARMLTRHPFVSGFGGDSPTGPFDFPDWPAAVADTPVAVCPPVVEGRCLVLGLERVGKLVGESVRDPYWAGLGSGGWVKVR